MKEQFYVIQCLDPNCDFRTSSLTKPENTICPRCHQIAKIHSFSREEYKSEPGLCKTSIVCLTILLDNIRSVYNVGSIFRTADGAAVQKIVLAGTTPTPNHAGIRKTGLGSEWSVDWEYQPNGLKAARSFQKLGYSILALETSFQSTPLFELHLPAETDQLLLVVGNEKTGVDPEILAMADHTVCLPMLGYKRSLNVASAAGIAMYYVRFLLPRA